jgi:hypothetical protein
MNRIFTFAIVSFLLTGSPGKALSQQNNCAVGPTSWCSNPPADMGYPDSLCSDQSFTAKYNFGSVSLCEAVLSRARKIKLNWCNCSLSPDGTNYKENCFPYSDNSGQTSAFCADLPPLNPVSANSSQVQPACHIDPSSWCSNPPSDLGWPDSLCSGAPETPGPTPLATAQECLKAVAQAREILTQWCGCTYQPDPNSPLRPGAIFYTQANGLRNTMSVALPPRNAQEVRQQAIVQAQWQFRVCDVYKTLPASWHEPRSGGMTRDQVLQECLSGAQAGLAKAQALPSQ